MQTNNFGVGLPPEGKNKASWDYKKPLLADRTLKPSMQAISDAQDHFKEFLRIRYSTPLLHLPSAAHIHAQLSFTNTGPDQV